jgi:hypothetical protein
MKRSTVLLLLLSSGFVWACGGASRTTDLSPSPSAGVLRDVPRWYSNPPEDPDYLLGPATATSRDMQVAVNKAQTEGRNQIAQQLDVRFSALAARFQEEVGIGDDSQLLDQFTQVYRAVTNEVVTGTRAREQEIIPERGIYRVYVLMEMPIGAASAALVSRVRAREHMYTRLRASEAFRELEAEIAKYEQLQKEQGGH